MNNVQLSKDGFIFSGNQQESVPRALFLDKRLTPLERNAWQVIRMMLEPDGITALPTYEQLRLFLASMPYAEKASFETVARALSVLRLSRWLSLIKKRRARDGSIQSNLYVLHDEPLTPFEAMRLDEDYFSLVCQSMNHASKAIQHVTLGVLDDIASDPYLSGKRLPTRLEILMGRMSLSDAHAETVKLSTTHESEEGKNNLLRNQKTPTSESEAGLKTAQDQPIRNPNKAVSSSNVELLLQEAVKQLNLPQRFFQLSLTQQKAILTTIQHLPHGMNQQIFNEWNDRCQSHVVRKPAAYLYGIVQKALQGEFNNLIVPPTRSSDVATAVINRNEIAKPEYVPPTVEEKEIIRKTIQDMKEKFLKRKP